MRKPGKIDKGSRAGRLSRSGLSAGPEWPRISWLEFEMFKGQLFFLLTLIEIAGCVAVDCVEGDREDVAS